MQSDLQRPDGWELLGLSRAENEQELHAILCLNEATKIQPDRASSYGAFVSHLDLSRAPYVLYGVKYIDLVSLFFNTNTHTPKAV